MICHSEIRIVPRFDQMEVLCTRMRDRTFPVHFHDTWVIQLVTSGADVCHNTGLSAKSRQVFVHAPFAAHMGGPAGRNTLAYRAIYPSILLTGQLLGALPVLAPISFVSECSLLARLIETFDITCPKNGRRQLKQIMRRVVDATCELGGRPAAASRSGTQDELAVARKYLVEHCRRDVSVAELSAVTMLSQFHLIRSFKKQFGITPRQFLISQRVMLAKKLLVQGVPIVVAALEAGFSDQSHLTRCFKRVQGFNPGEFVRGQADYLPAAAGSDA